MGLDSNGGFDQVDIAKYETDEGGESSAEKLTDLVTLLYDSKKYTLRWVATDNSDFSEPVSFGEDEIEVDLTGKGNGRPILGLTEEGIFQVIQTQKSDEPFIFPKKLKKIVNLDSGEWIIKSDNQGIALKSF